MFQEVANVGAGNAATALSELMMTQVHMGLPRSTQATSAELISDLPEDTPIAVCIIEVIGDLEGHLVTAFGDAEQFATTLGVGDADLDSAIGEIGNILCARFLVAVTELTGHFAEVTPPQVTRPVLAELGPVIDELATADPVTFIMSPLRLDGSDETSLMLFVPTTETLEKLGGLL
jgi:chemotaxis protein CheC